MAKLVVEAYRIVEADPSLVVDRTRVEEDTWVVAASVVIVEEEDTSVTKVVSHIEHSEDPELNTMEPFLKQ